jgi:hypothetical protein
LFDDLRIAAARGKQVSESRRCNDPIQSSARGW